MNNQKTLIEEKLSELNQLQNKIARMEVNRDRELAPHKELYAANTAVISAKYDGKISQGNQQIGKIAGEIESLLLQKRDKKNQPTLRIVTSESLTAAAVITEGARTADPKKLFEAAKDKGAAIWECFKVLLPKAESLIGKEAVDKISEKKTTWTVQITKN